jgi:polysaccharide export outer membrane protein
LIDFLRVRIAAVGLFALSSSALAADEAREVYLVGPNDVLQIEVYNEDDLSGEVTVNATGDVKRPHIGILRVEGMSVEAISTLVAEQYADGWLNNPQVSVQVLQHRSREVQVYGGVKQPGKYFLTEPTTLREILASAGWIDTKKSTREVRLQRDGETTTLTYNELITTESGQTMLEADDVVWVDEGKFVYVGGEVDKPGAQAFQDGLTVLQALTQAGGPTPLARLRGGYVLRGDAVISLNIKRMRDGKEGDIEMKPGDQLFLKESNF